MRQRLTPFRTLGLTVTMIALTCSVLPAQEGQTSTGLEPHDKAHALEPTHWCGVHAARSELVKAFSDCTYALSINPLDPQAIANRGSVYLMANDPQAALVHFERAIELRPEVALFYYNRGVAHSALGMSQKAVVDYSETIRLDPKYLPAYHNRGLEHERLGRQALAIQDYEAALSIDASFQQSILRLNALKGKL